MQDNGGTRSGNDRREFRYSDYNPEKRSGRDRRKGFDRRSPTPRRRGSERRINPNQQARYPLGRIDAFRT